MQDWHWLQSHEKRYPDSSWASCCFSLLQHSSKKYHRLQLTDAYLLVTISSFGKAISNTDIIQCTITLSHKKEKTQAKHALVCPLGMKDPLHSTADWHFLRFCFYGQLGLVSIFKINFDRTGSREGQINMPVVPSSWPGSMHCVALRSVGNVRKAFTVGHSQQYSQTTSVSMLVSLY